MEFPHRTRLRWFARDYPVTTSWLALALIAFALGQPALDWGALDRDALWDLQAWRLLTEALVHAGAWHMAGNAMLIFLLVPRIEQRFGRWRALMLLVLSALASSSVAVLWADGAPLAPLGASGALLGALAALGADAFYRREGWLAAYHDIDGYGALFGSFAALLVAAGAADLRGSTTMGLAGLAGGFLFGATLGDLWANRARHVLMRQAFSRALSVGLATAAVCACMAPWDPAWHLRNARRTDDPQQQRALLEDGLEWRPESAQLNHALWRLLRERAPAKALEHRLTAIDSGEPAPASHEGAARLEVASAWAERGEWERVRAVVRGIDPWYLDRTEAYRGLSLLVQADEEGRARTWAGSLRSRHPGHPIEHLCAALLSSEGSTEGLEAAREWRAEAPPGVPEPLVRWVDARWSG